MLADAERSIVVVIDLQGKLVDMVHRPELVKAASRRLMELAELFQVPVVLTEQYPKGLGPTHADVLETYDRLTVEKRVVEKDSFGCCGEPAYEEALRAVRPNLKPGERQIVFAGIEAHVCVLQTVLETLRQGDQALLCWEAISGRGEEYRRHALDRMQQAGAVLTNHESTGFEWARDKNHPQFKAMSRILKEGQLG